MKAEEFRVKTGDGLKLHGRHYRAEATSPDAPAIICLHGLTRNERDFAQLAEWLAGGLFADRACQVFALSFRGRGQSDRDPAYLNYQPTVYVRDVFALMEQFSLADAALIGTSLGGIVTMLAAAEAPGRVKAAILNDIGPELAPEGLARIAGYVGKTDPVTSWAGAAARMQEINGVAFPAADDAFWMRFARNTFREEAGVFALDYDPAISRALAEAGPAPDLWPPFRQMQCPILSIRGGISDLFTAEIQDRMKAAQPDMHCAVVPGIGHAPTLDEPAAQAAIKEFLRDLI